jgi:hypothetical protein
VRRSEPLEIRRNDTHRRKRDRQLCQRQRVERAAFDRKQLERARDIGNGLGTDRLVGDQQRGELGDLSETGADPGGVGVGESRCDACRTQGPGGVLRNTRQGLGEFESL